MINEKSLKKITLLLLCSLFILYAAGINNRLSTAGDNAGYIIWAKAILNGYGLNYINEPFNRDSQFNIYVFPLILLPFVFINMYAYWLFKSVIVIFSMAALYLYFKLIRNFFIDYRSFFFVFLLLALNPLYYEYSHSIMAEIPFIFFTISAVLLINFYLDNSKLLFLLSILILGFISYFTRKAGLIFLISIPVFLILKKKYKKFLYFTIPILLILLLVSGKSYINPEKGDKYLSIILMKSQYSPDSGKRNISDILKNSIRQTAVYSLKILPDTFFYPVFKNLRFGNFKMLLKTGKTVNLKEVILVLIKLTAGLIFTVFIITGFISKLRKFKIHFFDIYTILTLCVLLLWQISSSRYLLPVLPFLIIYLVLGIKRFFSSAPVIQKFIIYLIITINFLSIFFIIYRCRTNYLPEKWREYYNTLNYFRDNNISNVNVACRKPLLYYLNSKCSLKTAGYPLTLEPEHFFNYMRKNNIQYLILDDFFIGVNTARKYLIPVIKKYPENFEKVYSTGNFHIAVYKILKYKFPARLN